MRIGLGGGGGGGGGEGGTSQRRGEVDFLTSVPTNSWTSREDCGRKYKP